jgi:hypothetical protein
MFRGSKAVKERLLTLDATRLLNGDIKVESILSKYCSYLIMKK